MDNDGQVVWTRISHIQPQNSPNFPYWIAIDKHTDTGREMIIEAAQQIDVSPHHAMQLSFYLEGAVCNNITTSPYWQLAKDWQMQKMGYTYCFFRFKIDQNSG